MEVNEDNEMGRGLSLLRITSVVPPLLESVISNVTFVDDHDILFGTSQVLPFNQWIYEGVEDNPLKLKSQEETGTKYT